MYSRTARVAKRGECALLITTALWGLSYSIPAMHRIKFAQTFPSQLQVGVLVPIWVWGALMLVGSLTVILVERTLSRREDPEPHRVAWSITWAGHTLLAATFLVLCLAELAITWTQAQGHFPELCSGMGKPAVAFFFSYLHYGFATLSRHGSGPHADVPVCESCVRPPAAQYRPH